MNNIIEPGKIVKATVSGIANYGIFVNLENGYTGMIHISEVSDNYVKDLNDYAKIGERIPCKILEINYSTKKVKLSIKNLDYHLRRENGYQDNFINLKQMLPKWIEEKLTEIKSGKEK